MGETTLSADTVGMSESIGVAVLIGLTITVTSMVGMSVLIFDTDGESGPQANFTYDHVDDSGLLIVTHAQGDELEAGKIEFEGPDNSASWAELAKRNESELVGPGDLTQLGPENAYGSFVSARDQITVYYNQSGNRTQISEWSGG